MPTKQSESAPSFLQVYTQVRRDHMKHSFLRQISACVDWQGIRTLLNKKYTKTQNATGNPAYDALMMFKILLLQTWYDLSDYEVEERINDSLLFSEFLLLDMGLPAPDHQIAQKSPLSGGSSSREGARGRDSHLTSQPKDSEVRWRKVQAVKRWACAMVSGKEVCERLYISPRTLQDYRDRKIIPYTQFAGKILYKASDLEKMLEENYQGSQTG